MHLIIRSTNSSHFDISALLIHQWHRRGVHAFISEHHSRSCAAFASNSDGGLTCCLCVMITVRKCRLSVTKSFICYLQIFRKLRVYCEKFENFIFLWLYINLFFTNQNWINVCWFVSVLIGWFDLTLPQIFTKRLQWMLLTSDLITSIFVLFINWESCCDDRRLKTLNGLWACSSDKSRLLSERWRYLNLLLSACKRIERSTCKVNWCDWYLAMEAWRWRRS